VDPASALVFSSRPRACPTVQRKLDLHGASILRSLLGLAHIGEDFEHLVILRKHGGPEHHAAFRASDLNEMTEEDGSGPRTLVSAGMEYR